MVNGENHHFKTPNPETPRGEFITISREQWDALRADLQAKDDQINHLQNQVANTEERLRLDKDTSAYSKEAFAEDLPKILLRAGEQKQSVGLLILDVDGLKRCNDELGWDKGTELLRLTVHGLRQHLRPFDRIYRYFQGDEFAVILENFELNDAESNHEMATHAVERLGVILEEIYAEAGYPAHLHLGVSMGAGLYKPGETIRNFQERIVSLLQTNKKERRARKEAQGVIYSQEDPRIIEDPGT